MKNFSNRLRVFFARQRDLHKNRGRKHYHAPQQFPGAHLLAQQNRPGNDGKHRLQAHKKRCNGGVSKFLGDDLQGVTYAARDHAAI